MSVIKIENSTSKPNFLESEIGLITKTRQLPQAMGTADGQYKTVFAGTVFPADDGTATGIVFQDADVTDGDAAGSVLVAGRVLKDRLTVSDEAVKALIPLGIVFVDDEGKVYVPEGSVVRKLGDLEDVDLSTPATNDQVLKYSDGDNKWKAAEDSTAGG